MQILFLPTQTEGIFKYLRKIEISSTLYWNLPSEGKPREVVNTFTEAVQTIDPKQAVGKLASLWVNFAKFYEKNKQIEDSRIIFEKATHVAYLKVGSFIRQEYLCLNKKLLFYIRDIICNFS